MYSYSLLVGFAALAASHGIVDTVKIDGITSVSLFHSSKILISDIL